MRKSITVFTGKQQQGTLKPLKLERMVRLIKAGPLGSILTSLQTFIKAGRTGAIMDTHRALL